jgi:hypothetical protein
MAESDKTIQIEVLRYRPEQDRQVTKRSAY